MTFQDDAIGLFTNKELVVSTTVRDILAQKHNLSHKKVNQELSLLVDNNILVRIAYGKRQYYLLASDFHSKFSKTTMN